MHIKQYFDAVRSGVALALGFQSANAPSQTFTDTLIAAGEAGLDATLLVEKSTFDVRQSMVKNTESSAFGKMVGSVAVKVAVGNEESNVSIDMGTLAAFANNGGKTLIKAVKATASNGEAIRTRAGAQIYNFRAVNPPVYQEGTSLASLEKWFETIGDKIPTPTTP